MSEKAKYNRRTTLRSVAVLYKQGLYLEALDLARLSLDQAPDDDALWELCGLCCDALRDAAWATRALETATTLVPLSPAGQCVLARCYFAAGHRDLARQMYRRTKRPLRSFCEAGRRG